MAAADNCDLSLSCSRALQPAHESCAAADVHHQKNPIYSTQREDASYFDKQLSTRIQVSLCGCHSNSHITSGCQRMLAGQSIDSASIHFAIWRSDVFSPASMRVFWFTPKDAEISRYRDRSPGWWCCLRGKTVGHMLP